MIVRDRKKVVLLALATLVLLVAFAMLYLGDGNFAIRSLGLLLCVVSAYLVKSARGGIAAADGKKERGIARPGTVAWVVSALALVALGLSFFFLYRDALDGYHEVWPVYAFGAAIIVCAVVLPYMITKWIW